MSLLSSLNAMLSGAAGAAQNNGMYAGPVIAAPSPTGRPNISAATVGAGRPNISAAPVGAGRPNISAAPTNPLVQQLTQPQPQAPQRAMSSDELQRWLDGGRRFVDGQPFVPPPPQGR